MHYPFNVHVGASSVPGAALHAFASDRFFPRILSILAGFPLIFSILGFQGWFFPEFVPEAVGPDSYVRTAPGTLTVVSLLIFGSMAIAVWKHRSFYKTAFFVFCAERGGEHVLQEVEKVMKRAGGPYFGYTVSAYISPSAHAEFVLDVRAPKHNSFSSEAIVAGLRSSGFADVRQGRHHANHQTTSKVMRATN